MLSRFYATALAVAGLLPLSGCEREWRLLPERSPQRAEALAEQKCARQEYREAISLYESALDGTPRTAEVHFKLGLLYEEQLREPLGAVHHFERYLALAPQGGHAKEARVFLKEDRLRLTAELGAGATVSQEEAKRLKNANQQLQRDLVALKADLEAARLARNAAAARGSGPAASAQAQKPLVPGVRTHTVKSGETLASIARKFYQNPGRASRIQEANFAPMEGAPKLKPGMVLMVP